LAGPGLNAGRPQLPTEFVVVVDLAVENDDQLPGRRDVRLARLLDEPEPTDAEHRVGHARDGYTLRAAVELPGKHRAHVFLEKLSGCDIYDACDPAHKASISPRRALTRSRFGD